MKFNPNLTLTHCSRRLSLSFALLFLSIASYAQTLTLYPSADAQIGFHDHFNSADVNGGSASYFGDFWQPGAQGGENGGRGLIKFDLSSLPLGATVQSATLNVFGRGAISPAGGATSVGNIGDNVSHLQRVTSPWQEFVVTWNTQPTTETYHQATVGPSTQTIQDMSFDVTQLVTDQIAQPDSAFGWELRLVTEQDTRGLFFWSHNAPDSTKWPTLVISYSLPCNLQISTTPTNATCGNANGSVDVSIISGGVAPYTYLWSNGATTSNITNVAAGSFAVTVTAANVCSASATAIVTTTLPPSVADSVMNTTCGLSNGAVSLIVTGGLQPYNFIWSNGSTTQNLTNASGGIYNLTVADANGCTTPATVSVGASSSASISLAITNPTCLLAGSISATVTNGMSPYSFVWSNGGTQSSISDLSAGTYSVTVNDAFSCSASANADILSSSQNGTYILYPSADAQIGFHDGFNSADNNGGSATYFGDFWQPGADYGENGGRGLIKFDLNSIPSGTIVQSATLSVSGRGPITTTYALGIGNYGDNVSNLQRVTSPWDEFVVTWNTQPTTETYHQATVGPSTQTIQDMSFDVTQLVTDQIAQPDSAFGWELRLATEESMRSLLFWSHNAPDSTNWPTLTIVTASTPSPLSVAIITDSVRCDLSYVELSADASGGTQPYTYSWNDGTTAQSSVQSGTGPFVVTVTDANGCSAIDSIFVLGPPIALVQITGNTSICLGGSTTLGVDNTFPAYLWSNGSTSSSITVSSTGAYEVTVSTADGCAIGFGQATVDLYPLPTLTTSVTNGATGSIDLTVTGSGAPFTYSWSNGATTQDISGLVTGTYSVTVTTVNGCTTTTSAGVQTTTGCGLIVNVNGVNPTCNGAKNGSAITVLSGASGPFTYVWSNGKTSSSISGIGSGTYYVTVTNGDNCSATGHVTLIQPSGIIAYTNCAHVCPGACNGFATVTVLAGGTPPYSYLWSDGTTTTTHTNLCAGVYWVTITDAHGCKKTIGAAVAATAGIGCVAGRFDEGNDLGISLYPNPATDHININLTNFYGTGALRITNQLGQVLYSDVVTDQSQLDIDISRFADGIYYASFNCNDYYSTMKFIKQ